MMLSVVKVGLGDRVQISVSGRIDRIYDFGVVAKEIRSTSKLPISGQRASKYW